MYSSKEVITGRVVFAVQNKDGEQLTPGVFINALRDHFKLVSLKEPARFIPVIALTSTAELSVALAHVAYNRTPGDKDNFFDPTTERDIGPFFARLVTDSLRITPYERMIRSYLRDSVDNGLSDRMKGWGFTVRPDDPVDELPWKRDDDKMALAVSCCYQCHPQHVPSLNQALTNVAIECGACLTSSTGKSAKQSEVFYGSVGVYAILRAKAGGKPFLLNGPSGLVERMKMVSKNVHHSALMSVVPLDLVPQNPLLLAILALQGDVPTDERDAAYYGLLYTRRALAGNAPPSFYASTRMVDGVYSPVSPSREEARLFLEAPSPPPKLMAPPQRTASPKMLSPTTDAAQAQMLTSAIVPASPPEEGETGRSSPAPGTGFLQTQIVGATFYVAGICKPGSGEAEQIYDRLILRKPMWIVSGTQRVLYAPDSKEGVFANSMLDCFSTLIYPLNQAANGLHVATNALSRMLETSEDMLVDLNDGLWAAHDSVEGIEPVVKAFCTLKSSIPDDLKADSRKRALEDGQCRSPFKTRKTPLPEMIAVLGADNYLAKIYGKILFAHDKMYHMEPDHQLLIDWDQTFRDLQEIKHAVCTALEILTDLMDRMFPPEIAA